MKNFKIIIALTSLFFFNSNAYSKSKIIGLGHVNSFVEDYSSKEFKTDIINILIKNRIELDSTSTDPSKIDYRLTAKINTCNGNSGCYTVLFYLIDSKTEKIKEKYDEIQSAHYSENIEYVVEKSLMDMEAFELTEEWNSFFMPGVSFDTYHPRNENMGFFYGPSAEFVIHSRTKRKYSDLKGPSRIKT